MSGFFSLITTLATAVIAYYAYENHKLSKASHELATEMKKLSERNQDEFYKTLIALASATIVSGPMYNNTTGAATWFKDHFNNIKKLLKEMEL